MPDIKIAIEKILKASEILDFLNFEALSSRAILCAEETIKTAKKKKKSKRKKQRPNDHRSIVDNERITMETRKTQDKINSFGPETPYVYKGILSKEDLDPDVFFFAKNKDYAPGGHTPTVGLTDNVMNQTGFGMVDNGGGFLRD